ncbi:DUF4041 domain-containing protein [Kribbella sp. NPDC050281]|uniref:DUF4041 domain-containing protein n=1 Tax=Kribbella sp. NPDC050281 TaxID=3155515 RepID=UPI0033EA3CF1
MSYRFNPPPNWPSPPAGFVPEPGWEPDPSWPPAPPGWQLWVENVPVGSHASAVPEPPLRSPVAVRARHAARTEHAEQQTAPAEAVGLDIPGRREGRGLFGGKKRLENEVERLHHLVDQLGGMDALTIAAETDRLRDEFGQVQSALGSARQDVSNAQAELTAVRQEVIETNEVAMLQEVGIYEYSHPLEDAVAYKARLAELKDQYKALARADGAVTASTTWQVNNSAREGAKMVREISKLMLRAYNAEADNCVRTVRPHRRASSVERLSKARDSIARLGQSMNIRISEDYHALRVDEVLLTADYLSKVDEEKERIRAQREQQREEEAARREFEREKSRLLKERSHYETALARVQATGDTAAIDQLQAQIAEIESSIAGVEEREANIRAGYVYIISNLGSFGQNMIKIGMTRRLDPLDRVRELGDASVPFRFDVHAIIFSEDALGLEGGLHAAFAEKRVNKVNLRREYFYATPAEVRDELARIAGQHLLEYHDLPEALEWRASGGATPA